MPQKIIFKRCIYAVDKLNHLYFFFKKTLINVLKCPLIKLVCSLLDYKQMNVSLGALRSGMHYNWCLRKSYLKCI